jgi:glycine cleavage system H protein
MRQVNPEELRFNKTHEWVHVSEEGNEKTATVGLSAFAVEALTDLVFIELPAVGRQVTAGEGLGEVESVKAVSDLYSPVTGEVCEVNSELPDNLDMLSDDPYGKGWIAKIKMADDTGLADLMDYATYQRQCAEEEGE